MDPIATYRLMNDAMLDGDIEGAVYAALDLRDWFINGGFWVDSEQFPLKMIRENIDRVFRVALDRGIKIVRE